MATWALRIEGWTPDNRLSLNGRRRTHPLQVAKLTKDTKEVVVLTIRSRNLLKTYGVTEQANVAVVFTYPTRRRRDPDGLAGLCKPILDALVLEGLLVDDDCEHITLSVGAQVTKGETGTLIAVRDREITA